MPVLRDGNETVVPESNAILVYLAETLRWDDVYPLAASKAAERAEIQRWLHWMHRNSREFTIAYFAPLLRPDIAMSPEFLDDKRKVCVAAAKLLERQLAKSAFVATGSAKPTLADFAIYADLGQCQFLDVFDFAPYPNIRRWLSDMRKVKGYDETHEALAGIKPLVERAKAKAKASSRTQAKM